MKIDAIILRELRLPLVEPTEKTKHTIRQNVEKLGIGLK